MGEFVNDFKEGLGALHLVNGEHFVGEFKQDMVNGNGTFTRVNGEEITGVWELNKLREAVQE